MYAPWFITNAEGTVFKVTADVYGRITLVPSPGATPALPFIFLSDTITGQLYQLNLVDPGVLVPSPSTLAVTGSVFFPSTDPNGGTWWNQIINGRLESTKINPPTPVVYPPSSCPAPWYLEDQNGLVWKLVLDSFGRISPVESPGSTPALPFALLTDAVTKQTWQIVISASGALIATVVNVKARGSKWIAAEGPTGNVSLIEINNSVLQSVPVTQRTDIQVPVVGEIYNPEDYRPPFTQPGGIGTETFPTESTGELIALWAFGCGHFSNHIMVASGTVACQTAALLQCPLCDFLQRIIVPYSAIEDSNNEAYAYLFP